MKFTFIFSFVTCFVSMAFASDTTLSRTDFKMHFRANGHFSIETHLYGKPHFGDLGPGYRSDMMINTALVSYRELTFDFLTVASTSIARLPETPIKLDKIRYTLTPMFRYALRKSIVTLSLYHQCIHTLSRAEGENGSTWWNAYQISFGTKGAYPLYFIQKYNNRDFSLRNSFDATVSAGYYLHGEAPLIGNNHDYNVDFSGLIRYHFGLFRNQTIYMDLTPHIWVSKNSTITTKLSGEINYVILAFDNIASLYFNHCFIDENPYDNEFSLGGVGVRVVF